MIVPIISVVVSSVNVILVVSESVLVNKKVYEDFLCWFCRTLGPVLQATFESQTPLFDYHFMLLHILSTLSEYYVEWFVNVELCKSALKPKFSKACSNCLRKEAKDANFFWFFLILFLVIIVRTPGFELIDESFHNNAGIFKMIHKLFQSNRVVSWDTRVIWIIFLAFPTTEFCKHVIRCVSVRVVFLWTKNVFFWKNCLPTHGFSVGSIEIWYCYWWTINGILVCGL